VFVHLEKFFETGKTVWSGRGVAWWRGWWHDDGGSRAGAWGVCAGAVWSTAGALWRSREKAAGSIDVPFEIWTRVDPKVVRGNGQFSGVSDPLKSTGEGKQAAVVKKRLGRSTCRFGCGLGLAEEFGVGVFNFRGFPALCH